MDTDCALAAIPGDPGSVCACVCGVADVCVCGARLCVLMCQCICCCVHACVCACVRDCLCVHACVHVYWECVHARARMCETQCVYACMVCV